MIVPPIRGVKPSQRLVLSCCSRKPVGFTSRHQRITELNSGQQISISEQEQDIKPLWEKQ
jgi:hypothetical protein